MFPSRFLSSVVCVAAATAWCATTNPYESDFTIWGNQRVLTRPVVAVGAGLKNNVALQDDGTLVLWGDNLSGLYYLPGALDSVQSIAVGSMYGIAIRSNGTVQGWGSQGDTRAEVPTGLGRVLSLSAGQSHVAALRADSTVQIWGISDPVVTTIPQEVRNAKIKAVAVGDQFTLALDKNGVVYAWGVNGLKQCDIPTFGAKVKAIAAGSQHGMALLENGKVATWGNTYNSRSSGNPSASSINDTLTHVKAIAAGYGHCLALLENGTVVGWGGTPQGQTIIPTGLDHVVAIAGGLDHSVALKDDGSVVAWGFNDRCQTCIPAGATDVKSVVAGFDHVTILRNNGEVRSFGNVATTYNSQITHQAVKVPASLNNVKQVAAGSEFSVALRNDGTVVVWGDAATAPYSGPGILNGKKVRAIAAKGDQVATLGEDGSVAVWSAFPSTNIDSFLVKPRTGTWNQISLGWNHLLSVKDDGTVSSEWPDTLFPKQLGSIKALASGTYQTLALKADSSLVIWGDTNWSSGCAVLPAGLTHGKDVAAGQLHSMVLRQDGKIQAWGYDMYGQTDVPPNLGPVKSVFASGWTSGAFYDRSPTSSVVSGPSAHGQILTAGEYPATLHDLQGAQVWSGMASWTGTRWKVSFERTGSWILRTRGVGASRSERIVVVR